VSTFVRRRPKVSTHVLASASKACRGREQPKPSSTAVLDGTEVHIFIPPAKDAKHKGRGKSSVAQATFGIIPSDPAAVHAVLEEDLYDT
jgi:hypothetical protein